MSEDKARFLEVVGRAFGDDEVCYVSYVLGLEYDAHDVSSFYLMMMFIILCFLFKKMVSILCVIDYIYV